MQLPANPGRWSSEKSVQDTEIPWRFSHQGVQHQAVACAAGTHQSLHRSRGPGKPTLTDIQTSLRSTEVQQAGSQTHPSNTIKVLCWIVMWSVTAITNVKGQTSGENNIPLKLFDEEVKDQRISIPGHNFSAFLALEHVLMRKSNESQETLNQETNMWLLWLGYIHGLADAGEGGSTTQEESKPQWEEVWTC